ncbi:hypothetical protein BMF94_5776 [Rhodotorula taiwanensis]|uniref:Uncharacterized protein n=1 Tax=Rhodotorula taiwanensis TaxID=741276 RepID=A0A2S5B3U7_9BASI|nr:hypothetical protein BMF94_5776 [Rhodotorula taiwanensis]
MLPGPGNLTPAPTPPPPSDVPPRPNPAATPSRSSMSRVTNAQPLNEESDAAMGFAGEEVGSAASSESSVVDDLMRDDELAEANEPAHGGDEAMLTDAGADEVIASGTGGPALDYPASPSGPSGGSSRRAGGRPYPTRAGSGANASSGPSGSRGSRRERASQMFSNGGGEFERERAALEGRRGGGSGSMRLGGEGEGGDAKSPEEVALSKVIDKDYVGKLHTDPFWAQACAIRQARGAAGPISSTAETSGAETRRDATAVGGATVPADAGTAGTGAATLPPPVPAAATADSLPYEGEPATEASS